MWPIILDRQSRKSFRHGRKTSNTAAKRTFVPVVERLEDRRVLASWTGWDSASPPADVSAAADTAGQAMSAAMSPDQLGDTANGGSLGLALWFGGQQGRLGDGPDVQAVDELMSVLGLIAAFGESDPGAGFDPWVGMGPGSGYHQPGISSPLAGLFGEAGIASQSDGSSFFTPRPPTSSPSSGPDMGMTRNDPYARNSYTDDKGNGVFEYWYRDGSSETMVIHIFYDDGGMSVETVTWERDGTITVNYFRDDEDGNELVAWSSSHDDPLAEPQGPADMVFTLEEAEDTSPADGGSGDSSPDETEYPVPDDGSGTTGVEPSELREARQRHIAQILGRTPDGQGNPADIGGAFYDGWLLGMTPTEAPTVRDMTTQPGAGNIHQDSLRTANFDHIVATISREQDGQPAPSP